MRAQGNSNREEPPIGSVNKPLSLLLLLIHLILITIIIIIVIIIIIMIIIINNNNRNNAFISPVKIRKRYRE